VRLRDRKHAAECDLRPVLPVVGHEDSIADDTLDQTLELQSRWFGDTRNIVEQRQLKLATFPREPIHQVVL